MYLAVLVLTGLGGLLFFSKLYRELLMLVLATAAGLLAVGYQKYNIHTFRNSRLENAVVKVTDSGALEQKFSPDEQRLKRITVSCNGKRLQLYIPHKLQDVAMEDGKEYRVTGNVYAEYALQEYFLLDQQGHWQDASTKFRRSNYQGYLARNGIGGILYLEKIEPLPESGFIKNRGEISSGIPKKPKRGRSQMLSCACRPLTSKSLVSIITEAI
jgi:hypothetical protein